MQQKNPQPMGASEHDEVSQKMVELSGSKRGNSTLEEEFQIEQNNPRPVVASEIQLDNEPQQSTVAPSCSATPNNYVRTITPSHKSSVSTRPPVEVPKFPNLPGLFYFGPGSLCRVDHVGICKPEDNSLWELNMDPELVRSWLGSSEFPSIFDKELLDYVGNRGMLTSLFAMLGYAMAMSARLMDSTVDINDIRTLKNEIEGLWLEKKELSDTLDMKLQEIRNLESAIGREKTMVEHTREKLKDVHDFYMAEHEKFEQQTSAQLKTIEDKLKEVEAELEEKKKRGQSIEEWFEVEKKEAEAVKEEAKTCKEEAEIAKEEVRASKQLADVAELRAKTAEYQLSLIKEASDKREAELISKIADFGNIDLKAFEDGFQRALRQFPVHHPTLDCSIFDMDKDVVNGKNVEDNVWSFIWTMIFWCFTSTLVFWTLLILTLLFGTLLICLENFRSISNLCFLINVMRCLLYDS